MSCTVTPGPARARPRRRAQGDRVAGINIAIRNLLPITNIAADSPATVNTSHANFSTTVGVVFQREALGTVKLMDMSA